MYTKFKYNNIYVFRSEYWELAAQGEQETPLQKYYRLKFETEELLIQESNFQIVSFQLTYFGKLQSFISLLQHIYTLIHKLFFLTFHILNN